MAIPVLILGESGTGKTTSLRNCPPERFGIINVSKKPLPFRSSFKTYNTDDYGKITGALKLARAPSMVIDDSQYLMVNAFMRRSKEKGYDKYTDIANAHWSLVDFVINYLPEDMIVYFMSHINSGFDTVKTPLGMFDADDIDNDLLIVDDAIREFYSLGGKRNDPDPE